MLLFLCPKIIICEERGIKFYRSGRGREDDMDQIDFSQHMTCSQQSKMVTMTIVLIFKRLYAIKHFGKFAKTIQCGIISNHNIN